MTVILIHLVVFYIFLYTFLYFNPSIDKSVTGDWIVWYTYRNQINKGIFKKERRYFYIKQFKL